MGGSLVGDPMAKKLPVRRDGGRGSRENEGRTENSDGGTDKPGISSKSHLVNGVEVDHLGEHRDGDGEGDLVEVGLWSERAGLADQKK